MDVVTESLMESKVYIVGAGPGDPELLTLKAHRLISSADIVFYDRLMSKEILEFCKQDCELVFVGKKDKRHFVTQEGTNQLIVDAARKHKVVVRLKGGDPFIFGRGGEEEIELHKQGISFETVPGVSSSVAAPAYAGIPLTHRYVARSFAVVTGHLAKDIKDEIVWSNFVNVDTLVVLMGIRRREQICKDLIGAGRSPDELIAFIENGATPDQRVVVSNLSDVSKGLTDVYPPAIMVIGQVVKFRDQLKWFTESEEIVNKTSNDATTCIF